MNPRVKTVEPLSNYQLKIGLDNGEIGYFDVSKYLSYKPFERLKDRTLFNKVKPFLGSISWNEDIDFCPDTVYIESKKSPLH